MGEVVYIKRINGNEIVEMFLNSINASENTRKSYSANIKQYFELTRGKRLSELNKNDFRFDLDIFEIYLDQLRSTIKNIKPRTINQKIYTMKRFINFLSSRANRLGIDPINTDFLNSIEKPKFNEEEGQYDAFEISEIEKMIELAKQERFKGEMKSLFIKFAFATGLRKNEIRSVTWDSIKLMDDGMYHFKVKGKNNNIYRRSLTKDEYNELLKIKDQSKEGRIFDLSDDEIHYLINNMLKKLNIKDNRILTFHSIRKTSAIIRYRQINDIIKVKEFLGHKNIETTMRYIKTSQNVFLSHYGIKEELNSKILEKLTKEELLELINTSGLEDVKLRLIKEAKIKFKNLTTNYV